MSAIQPPSQQAFPWRTLRRLIVALLLAPALVAPAGAQQGPPPNVAISPGTPATSQYQSPFLAVDPRARDRLALAYYEWNVARECRLARSPDAGLTWTDAVIVGDGGQISLPAGEFCLHARVAYGPDGTVYYMYTQTQAGSFFAPWSIWVATSRDGGTTFAPPVRLADRNALRIIHAQTAITVDQASGRVYAAWANADPNRHVLLSSSTDRGASFSAPVRVVPPEQTLTDEPGLVVGRRGELYVSWRRAIGSGVGPEFHVRSSTDGGATFGAARLVGLRGDPGCGVCTRPSHFAASNVAHAIAGGNSPGELFVVAWRPDGGTDSVRRIVFSASRDGGETWTPEQIVGVPPGAEARDQVRPWISVTPGGRIEIVYYDMGTATGALYDVYEIHSDDGATFSAPRKLTEVSSDSRFGAGSFTPGTAQLGARLGVASSADYVFTAWTDARRGSITTLKHDVFFARIALPAPPTPAAPPAPGAARTEPRPPVAPSPFPGCPASTANVIRADAANPIVGTPGADRIFGGAGNDTADGLAGDDCIDVGPGADRGVGGPGADLILGGLGQDRLTGSSGNDSIAGGAGRDRLTGGAGRDRIAGDSGADRIEAGDGRGGDRITCGGGRDRVTADRGDRVARDCELVRRRQRAR